MWGGGGQIEWCVQVVGGGGGRLSGVCGGGGQIECVGVGRLSGVCMGGGQIEWCVGGGGRLSGVCVCVCVWGGSD